MRPSLSRVLLRSLFLSYLLSAILLVILAFGMYKLNLSKNQTAIVVYVIYGLSCFAGGLLAGKTAASRRFFWGFFTGTVYFLLLFFLSFLFQGGVIPHLQHSATVLAACLACGILGGIVS